MDLKIKRNYDIIIFGVTSFTGKWLVLEVLNVLKDKSTPKFTWAVASRSEQKIKDVLHKIESETGEELVGKVDMIIADCYNPPSIQAMVKQCQIVLNCVGPYTEWGEIVVKACAEEGTHHLDLCAEPVFLGKMEIKYSKIAEMTNSYIIGACGFGSVPSDIGAEYLVQNFDGEISSIESICKFPDDGSKMQTMHEGTWQSVTLGAHQFADFIKLRSKLYSSGYPPSPRYRLSFWPLQYRKEVEGWAIVMPVPDGDVMERSQRWKFQNEASNDNSPRQFIQTRMLLQFPSLFRALFFMFCSFYVLLLSQFKFTLNLLNKYPKIFSWGYCTPEGPTEEEMKQMKYTFTVVAKGWSKEDKEFADTEAPNKTKVLKIKGSDPAYGGAVIIFLQAALTILADKNKMPKKGGVYSPGIAFAKTGLIDRLRRNGVMFELEN